MLLETVCTMCMFSMTVTKDGKNGNYKCKQCREFVCRHIGYGVKPYCPNCRSYPQPRNINIVDRP